MKEKLLEIKSEIADAYSLLSLIDVSGDDVDRMAETRKRLRRAFLLLKDQAEALDQTPSETGGGGKRG